MQRGCTTIPAVQPPLDRQTFLVAALRLLLVLLFLGQYPKLMQGHRLPLLVVELLEGGQAAQIKLLRLLVAALLMGNETKLVQTGGLSKDVAETFKGCQVLLVGLSRLHIVALPAGDDL